MRSALMWWLLLVLRTRAGELREITERSGNCQVQQQERLDDRDGDHEDCDAGGNFPAQRRPIQAVGDESTEPDKATHQTSSADPRIGPRLVSRPLSSGRRMSPYHGRRPSSG